MFIAKFSNQFSEPDSPLALKNKIPIGSPKRLTNPVINPKKAFATELRTSRTIDNSHRIGEMMVRTTFPINPYQPLLLFQISDKIEPISLLVVEFVSVAVELTEIKPQPP